MKQIHYIVLIVVCIFNSKLNAQNVTQEKTLSWNTELMKANELSNETNKPIFAFFTGSDWCGWCKKLQRDVYSKPAFIEWAAENVILLELDFPKNTKLNPEITAQNSRLQQSFKVQGYPTIWLFTMKKDETTENFVINQLGSCGYPSGFEEGKQEVKFINDCNAILLNKK